MPLWLRAGTVNDKEGILVPPLYVQAEDNLPPGYAVGEQPQFTSRLTIGLASSCPMKELKSGENHPAHTTSSTTARTF